MNQCAHAYTSKKISKFLCRGFPGPKTAKIGNFKGLLVVQLLLKVKLHNFEQWESFWVLVDIPRMCHLYRVWLN